MRAVQSSGIGTPGREQPVEALAADILHLDERGPAPIRASWTTTALGWESRAITRASRRNRACISGSKALFATMSFKARGASSSRCRTSQTEPIPPSPIIFSTR